MKDFFEDLIIYTYKSNLKIMDLIIKSGDDVPANAHWLYCHILNAHNIWNARIMGHSPDYKVWDVHDNKDLHNITIQNQNKTMRIIGARNFEESITYKNFKGEEFANTLQEILYHIINHSTHHRAQIVMELRNADIIPPATDYIFYKRLG